MISLQPGCGDCRDDVTFPTSVPSAQPRIGALAKVTRLGGKDDFRNEIQLASLVLSCSPGARRFWYRLRPHRAGYTDVNKDLLA